MSPQLYSASIAESCGSEDDDLNTPRLSYRLSLLFLIGTSALGYGLAYQGASWAYHIVFG